MQFPIYYPQYQYPPYNYMPTVMPSNSYMQQQNPQQGVHNKMFSREDNKEVKPILSCPMECHKEPSFILMECNRTIHLILILHIFSSKEWHKVLVLIHRPKEQVQRWNKIMYKVHQHHMIHSWQKNLIKIQKIKKILKIFHHLVIKLTM
eukprot:jgi/Orpsp1_1/1174514/evm.model.c7180000050382.1